MTDRKKALEESRHSSAPPDGHARGDHKENVREGGIEADPGDPMGQAPSDESYARDSGKAPAERGAPRSLQHQQPAPDQSAHDSDEAPGDQPGPRNPVPGTR